MTRKITPAQLDKIEAAAKEATPGGLGVVALDSLTALALIARLREAEAKVERVEAIHRPMRFVLYPGTSERVMEVCAECRTRFGDWYSWPCPTMRALEEA